MKSMWYEIRKNVGLSQSDIAKQFGVSRQYIHRIEMGKYIMPIKYQIYYLSLRNSDEDKIIIEYLKELSERKCGEINEKR